jgi:ADP-ribosylglycohydrolase
MIAVMTSDQRRRALGSLSGLAVGDALGSQFFVPSNRRARLARELPPGTWSWTDDTEMACSVYLVLDEQGQIDQDALAHSFAVRHDFDRGYGPATNRMLRLVREGGSWRQLSRNLFDGQGSWGNGAAMRVAPLGAWYADDLDLVVEQAALSAAVTHTHPEAIAGAVAVAVAAAVNATAPAAGDAASFLATVSDHVPPSLVRDGIRTAVGMCELTDAVVVASVLGNGRLVSAQDTVPFALWAAAMHRGDYQAAFWATASAGGDIDTTCAIVGGIVSSAPDPAAKPPPEWLVACERLPRWMGRQSWPIVRPRLFPAPSRLWSGGVAANHGRVPCPRHGREMERARHRRPAVPAP